MQRVKTQFIPFIPNLEAYGPIKCNRASFVDAKLDGEYGVWYQGSIFNKNGMARTNFPACNAADILAEKLSIELELEPGDPLQMLGELCWEEGKAGDLYKLLANKESNALKYTVFDFYYPDNDYTMMDRREILMEAWQKAYRITEEWHHLQITPFKYCEKGEVEDAFNSFIQDGYEGVVIKPIEATRPGGFKWKSVETSDLKVLSADPWKARIGLEDPSRPGVELCGCKYDGADKAELVGKIIEVQYLQKLYNSNGGLSGLRNPSFVRVRGDKTEASL